MSVTHQVIEYAKQSNGVITTHEAEALGMSRHSLATRANDGIFVRVARGVYVLPGTSTRPDLMMRVACQTLNAVVSHESAATFHGFEPIESKIPSITVSHRSTHSFPGVLVHQSTDLLDTHLIEADGVRITNPERTIIDLSKTTAPGRLDRIVENAVLTRRVDLDALADLHGSLARRGKPGARRLRSILERRSGPPEVSATVLEARMLTVLREGRLPDPVREFHAPWLKPIDGRVDLAYMASRLVVEGDSRRWHAMFDAFEEDRRRDNAALLAGWRVLRFTWRMIVDEPDRVVAQVRQALGEPN